MVIEITGVPGSGKSSIYSTIENKMNDVKFISNKQKGLLNELKLFTIYAVHFHKMRYNNLILKLIIKSNNTLYHKLNIVRNVIKKIAIYSKYKDKKNIYIFDEGISHLPFNVFVDSSKKKTSNIEISNFINQIPTPDLLLVINAGKVETTRRLKDRGHKRIDLSNDEKMKIFISKSFIVRDQIIRYYKNNNKKYKIITNNNSIENAVKVAKNIIEKYYI
jgi:broad-specificity NMP kinase